MGQYGQAALDAIGLLKKGRAKNPPDAWNQATLSFPSASQGKSCPQNAFLGLCSAGYVRGVSSGNYTRSRKNKWYATKAADMLKANPSLTSLGELGLWQKVLKSVGEPTNKTYNQQMDVVMTLFQNGLII